MSEKLSFCGPADLVYNSNCGLPSFLKILVMVIYPQLSFASLSWLRHTKLAKIMDNGNCVSTTEYTKSQGGGMGGVPVPLPQDI